MSVQEDNTYNSLSIQLCKLIEMKPVYTIIKNIGDLDYMEHKFVHKTRFELLRRHLYDFNEYALKDKNKDTYIEDDIYGCSVYNIQEEYVDFETPDNFIKLMELPNILIGSTILGTYTQKDYTGTMLSALNTFGFYPNDRKSFIIALITAINKDFFEDLDQVKQLIKEQEWSY